MELRKYIREMVESELAEMARISTNIKLGDEKKVAAAKKLHAGTWIEDLINAVEEAGEAGIPQPALAKALGKSGMQAINPIIRKFLDASVLTKGELSQAKKEKEPSTGVKGRPTSEKTLMAKAVNSKLEADNDYEPTEDELEMLGSEFIEKLRARVMGTLRRGRKIGPSKAKDGMVAAVQNIMNTSDEDGDGDVDDEDLDLALEENFLQNIFNKFKGKKKEDVKPASSEWKEHENLTPDQVKAKYDEYNKKVSQAVADSESDTSGSAQVWAGVYSSAIEDLKKRYPDVLKENLNESFIRMQKLAGLITESEFKKNLKK